MKYDEQEFKETYENTKAHTVYFSPSVDEDMED